MLARRTSRLDYALFVEGTLDWNIAYLLGKHLWLKKKTLSKLHLITITVETVHQDTAGAPKLFQ